jgi:hypothetical protein
MALCVTLHIKHLEKFLSVFGGLLIFPPRKGEGSYAYSLRVGETYALFTCVRFFPPLRSKYKNPPLLCLVIKECLST